MDRTERLARFAAGVDWTKVSDPYSGGQYGPGVLERLWSGELADACDARMDLHYACLGDGSSVLPAAAQVLPFLIDAAADTSVAASVRSEVLQTIADIARTGNSAGARIDSAWADVWHSCAMALKPLLDAPEFSIRAAAAAALAQAAGHADEVIGWFQAKFSQEADADAAAQLVLGMGTLAAHQPGRRAEALAWLRERLTVADKGPEPDIDTATEAWLAWTDRICHDLRLPAVAALRHADPDQHDPRYASATAEFLLGTATRDYHPWEVSVISNADEVLGADQAGRTALALALLRAPGPTQRRGGLQIAASLIARWRSAQPTVLPAVADLIADPEPENRVQALRVLAMCTTAALPWAGLVAARLRADTEPHERARTCAAWALARMGASGGVAALAELLKTPSPLNISRFSGVTPGWKAAELNFPDALAAYPDEAAALLPAVLGYLRSLTTTDRAAGYSIFSSWQRAGADVVAPLLELLGTDQAVLAAQALAHTGVPAPAAGYRSRLRELLGPPSFWPAHTHISPFTYHRLTGDNRPLLALIDESRRHDWPMIGGQIRPSDQARACVTLGPLAAPAAGWLRGRLAAVIDGTKKLAFQETLLTVRALWQVTGDATEVLPGLLQLATSTTESGNHADALTLLGAIAAAHPPVVSLATQHLARAARTYLDRGSRAAALKIIHALWDLTADPDQVVAPLAELVAMCPAAGSFPAKRQPLTLFAEIAAVSALSISTVTPQLRTILDADERPGGRSDWFAVVEDEDLCAAAQAVLDAAAR